MKNVYIVTTSGHRFDFDDPTPESVLITDIAYSLARTSRFGGHYPKRFRWYSVAEHSILVSQILEEQLYSAAMQLTGLLHDAPEAYLADLPSPARHLCEDFNKLEDKVMRTILEAFDLPYRKTGLPSPVLLADKLALGIEAAAFEVKDIEPQSLQGIEVRCLEPKYAFRAFMRRFEELQRQLGVV